MYRPILWNMKVKPIQPVRRAARGRHAESGVARDPLEILGVASSAARIIRYFALRTSAEPHARLLQRALGIGGASLQRELERLVAMNVLNRSEDGRLVRYRMVQDSPLWPAFRIIVGEVSDPAGLVRDALCDVDGLHAAFIFGSTAKNARRRDSDVDLFVLEDSSVDRRALLGQLAEAGLLLHLQVNAIRYTPQSLAKRLVDANHAAARFVREVLQGPKRWVAGDVEILRPLATAAGIRMANAQFRFA
jgi:predicted nucleotidyltransferase